MADAGGPELLRAEMVTLLNDLCVLAPAALVDAPIRWEPVDAGRVRAAFTLGANTVSAELVFDRDGDLVDFVSDDRLRASADGRTLTRQRWSTPLRASRSFGVARIPPGGQGRWHAPQPEGEFAYIEFQVDELSYHLEPVGSRAHAPGGATTRASLGAFGRVGSPGSA